MYCKRTTPNCNGNRHDKVALRTACIENDNFKIINIRIDWQHVDRVYCSVNLNWAAGWTWLV